MTRHHPHTWELIRDDYLAGQPRALLAERYGLGESTIRDRAAREGWRRADQPPAPPPARELELDEITEFEPMRSHIAIIADAYRFADLFMRRGRPAEARRYLAIARDFERLNRTDPLTRALHHYWDKQEQFDLDTAHLRGEIDAHEPEDHAPEPPNPPNPPNDTQGGSPEAVPAAPASEPDLAALIARRRAHRLPFHDLTAAASHAALIAAWAPPPSPQPPQPANEAAP